MRHPTAMDRRALLQSAALIALGGLVPGAALAADRTPRQVLGPYYPLAWQIAAQPPTWWDTDLCRVPGSSERATGLHALLHGVVTDADGRPATGAVVEIWQACNNGRYLNAHDSRRRRERDPHFQYFGIAPVDAEGRYAFRTLVPPEYPAGPPGWIRPPHVHVKVTMPGIRPFVTQMYFDDPANPDNARNLTLHRKDQILGSVAARYRELLVRPTALLADTPAPAGPAADLVAAIGLEDFGDAPRIVSLPIVPRAELVQPG